MSWRARLDAVQRGAPDPDTYAELAREALSEGEEESVIPLLLAVADKGRDALLWQWAGLLQRSLDEHAAALKSFGNASRLAPGDAKIAHGHARIALEAGQDAVALFERARALAPADGEILLGLAAARTAVGDGERGAAELAAVLDRSPLWLVGHQQLAQLQATLGRPDQATASVERALAAHPADDRLWTALFAIHLRRENFAALAAGVERARAAGVPGAALQAYEAIAAAELDHRRHPPALFDPAGPANDAILGIWRIRHLLRAGAVDEALPIIDRELATERAAQTWPYALIAWRMAGDARSQWLEGDAQLVSIQDLTDLPPLDRLAELLRSLHVAKGEYLDQSVRGGTQTDGPLLCRVEPDIRALRRAVVAAVERHVAKLPPPVANHPLLAPRRDRRIRFSGSWSVRLRGAGHHANHVHPQGWISSALYIALPERRRGEPDDAGWLTLGEPQAELGVALPPRAKIEPKPGRLVLFPSWMWHGTRAFAQGERLTVAFDVRPPI